MQGGVGGRRAGDELGRGGTRDEAPEDVVPALRSEQGARAVRRRTSAGERAGGAGERASRGGLGTTSI